MFSTSGMRVLVWDDFIVSVSGSRDDTIFKSMLVRIILVDDIEKASAVCNVWKELLTTDSAAAATAAI